MSISNFNFTLLIHTVLVHDIFSFLKFKEHSRMFHAAFSCSCTYLALLRFTYFEFRTLCFEQVIHVEENYLQQLLTPLKSYVSCRCERKISGIEQCLLNLRLLLFSKLANLATVPPMYLRNYSILTIILNLE